MLLALLLPAFTTGCVLLGRNHSPTTERGVSLTKVCAQEKLFKKPAEGKELLNFYRFVIFSQLTNLAYEKALEMDCHEV